MRLSHNRNENNKLDALRAKAHNSTCLLYLLLEIDFKPANSGLFFALPPFKYANTVPAIKFDPRSVRHCRLQRQCIKMAHPLHHFDACNHQYPQISVCPTLPPRAHRARNCCDNTCNESDSFCSNPDDSLPPDKTHFARRLRYESP